MSAGRPHRSTISAPPPCSAVSGRAPCSSPPPRPVISGQPPRPVISGQPPRPAISGRPPFSVQPPRPAISGQPLRPAISGRPPCSGPSAHPPLSGQPPRTAGRPPHATPSKRPPHAAISGKPPRPANSEHPPRSAPYGRFTPNLKKRIGAEPQRPTKPQWNSSTKLDSQARPSIAAIRKQKVSTTKTTNSQVLLSSNNRHRTPTLLSSQNRYRTPTSSPIPHIEVCVSPEIKRVPTLVLFADRQMLAEVNDGRRCRQMRLGDGSVLEGEEAEALALALALPSPSVTATCDKHMQDSVDGASKGIDFADYDYLYARTPLWMEGLYARTPLWMEEPSEDFSFEDEDVSLPFNVLSSFSSVIISFCTDNISVSSATATKDSEDSTTSSLTTMSSIDSDSGDYDCGNWRDFHRLPPDDSLVLGVCEAGDRSLSFDDSLVLGVCEAEDWDFTSACTGNDCHRS